MSTSPSWFDQEKFSRLVKKVGTTTRSVGAQSASPLPASNPSAPNRAQPPPTSASVAEASVPASSVDETSASGTASAIPKPAASLPLFNYKAVTPVVTSPKTTPEPAVKTPEPVPEETPEPPPAAPLPVARVFLAPPPAEASVSAPEPEEEKKPNFTFETPKAESEAEEEKKPVVSVEIPKAELTAQPLSPEPATEKAESATDLHVAEPRHVSPKPGHAITSTLQRLPRIAPGGSKPSSPPTSSTTLLRRTTSLPGVTPLTAPIERMEAPIRIADAPASSATSPIKFASTASMSNIVEFPKEANTVPPLLSLSVSSPAETFEEWQSPVVLPDETASYKEQIAHLNQERDNLAAKVAEFSLAARERDEARSEAADLRQQLAVAQQSKEVILVLGERDAARRDYAELRQQYEKLKQDQLRLKNEHAASLLDQQKQIEAARQQGGSHEQQFASGKDDVIETLKQELKSLHEQVERAKDEASTAQRGLALSQKALQETRDALREASDAKGALDGFKKERSTLVQQNMLLQAQNDQIVRELSALKAKVTK